MKYVIMFFALIMTTTHAWSKSSLLNEIFSSAVMQDYCKQTMRRTSPTSWVFYNPRLSLGKTTVYAVQRELIAERKYEYQVLEIGINEAQEIIFRSESRIEAIASYDNGIWIATRDKVKFLDKDLRSITLSLDARPFNSDLQRDEEITDIKVFGDNLYIAHGLIGLVARDARDGGLLFHNAVNTRRQDSGHRSKVSSLSISEDGLIFAGMNGVTVGGPAGSRAFSGFVSIDPLLDHEYFTSAYDYRRSGVLSRERTTISGHQIFANNSGHLQAIPLQRLRTSPTTRFQWHPLRRDILGVKDNPGLWRGDIIAYRGIIYGCAEFTHFDRDTREITKIVWPIKFSPSF